MKTGAWKSEKLWSGINWSTASGRYLGVATLSEKLTDVAHDEPSRRGAAAEPSIATQILRYRPTLAGGVCCTVGVTNSCRSSLLIGGNCGGLVRPGDEEESKVDARETVPPSRRLRA